MISKTTIDEVFETARVEEVIGDFIQLKKAGSNYKGLSPFSEERTPSFMVSPVKQIWKDFSSGKGGTVVTFLMEHEQYTYPEAIRYLAIKYNIEIEETQQTDDQKEKANAVESMYLLNEYACQYFQKTLLETNLGKSIGLSYFKERGFTVATIKKFQLGYALDQWEAFTTVALTNGYNIKYLENTGLTIVKENKQFDRFKGRVMFPIHSMSGRVLGFGGRILDKNNRAAKYLNSPESDIYHKSKIIYGIFFAKQSIAKLDNCYLVEGYTDVIQFYQKGIKNVVSSSGTALSANQIRLIGRLTKNITVLFDGDDAGIRASLRGIDLILEQGLNVRVCTFPKDEDPDSFARANSLETLTQYLNDNAQDFMRFKASLLIKDAKEDPIKKAELVRDIVMSISKIPDRIKREIYIQECSKMIDVSEEVLFSTLAQIIKKQDVENQKKLKTQNRDSLELIKVERTVKKNNIQYELEKKIIELLILYGNMTEEFEDLSLKENEEGELILVPIKQKAKVYEKIYLDLQEDEMEFSNLNFKTLYYTLIDLLNQNQNQTIETMIGKLSAELQEEIANIIMNEERYTLNDWQRKNIFPKMKHQSINQLVSETILSLRCFLIDMRVNEYKNEIQDTNSNRKEILEDVLNYSNLKMLLSRKLSRVL